MSLFSWLQPSRKKAAADESIRGPQTGCDLSNVDALLRPFARGPFHRLRPPLTHEAALLSAELASTAYSLELDPWKAAGWNDFSVLIDDSLQSGMDHGGVSSHFKLFKARAALREYNPFSQLAGALRQRERSDTVKAVCMMRPVGDGRFVLALGFMGTGSRFYDWISNFRFTPEEGFHRGFYQLCESFESNADEIVFPSAAEALGLEKLTLNDVFASLRSLSSPFRLWMAGHSQGGAVMQVLAHRLMTERGVLAQNMVGYGFASPTVATGRFVYDPAAYPLCHFINRDDAVPRLGALVHLGLCVEYRPDDDFRRKYYNWSERPEDAQLREDFRFVSEGMQDMPSALMHLCALTSVLAEEKGAEGMNELLTSRWAVPAVDKVLWRAGDRALDALDRFLTNAEDTYLTLTGEAMNETSLGLLRERMRPLIQKTSLRRLVDVLNELGVAPHSLDEGGRGVYVAMVLEKLDEMHPFIWVKASSGLPVRRWGLMPDEDAWPELETPVYARRRRLPLRTLRGRLRTSYSARRTT